MSNQTKPAPPKIVIAPEGCNGYLTAGKAYKVISIWDDWDEQYGYGFNIIDDDGEIINPLERHSAHIKDQDWIIKEREVSHESF